MGERGDAPSATAKSLAIHRIKIANHIRGISWERADGTVDALIYEVWAAPLEDMVSQWLREELIQGAQFSEVLSPDDASTADWELTFTLLRFEIEERRETPLQAVAMIEAEVRTRNPLGRPSFSSTLICRAPVAEPATALSLVDALRQALGQGIAQLGKKLPASLGGDNASGR
jgi:ABC-type uncharacterized transport system auxiliary subunit